MKNYYAILEVPVGCSLEEIRQAYRRLVQENLDNEAAFFELKEAYETLTTPARRAEYDLAAWGETFPADGAETTRSSGGSLETNEGRAGRCPMGTETQCPVLQARLAPTDKFCPECGFLLSTLSSAGSFDPPAEAEDTRQARLEEPGGRMHRLRPGLNLVGRESADILLPDKTISRQHARLELGEDGTVTVEDLSSTNGTQVNDVLLTPHVSQRLAEGDRVRFGSIVTHFHLPQLEAAPEEDVSRQEVGQDRSEVPPSSEPRAENSRSTARARVVDMRDGNGPDFPLVPGVTTFGRRAENSVVLQGDPYVSGSHAQIIAEDDVFRLTDVGSTNGTLLNGERMPINEPVVLSPGDVILIGGTALRFEPIVSAAVAETMEEAPAEPRERIAEEYDVEQQEARETEAPAKDAEMPADLKSAEG